MLKVNRLTGFGSRRAAVSSSPVALTYVTNVTDSTDQTTYTFASTSIGTASSDRVVVVVIGSRANAARSISSVTVGGNSATAIATANNSGGGAEIAAIYAVAVPSGTTASIVVTFSAAMLRIAVGVYTLTGTGGAVTAYGTATQTPSGSSPTDSTIDCPANGGILAVNFSNSSATSSTTWTGLTERFDVNPETSSSGVSSASDNFASAQTNLTVTATVASVTVQQAMAIASWGPA